MFQEGPDRGRVATRCQPLLAALEELLVRRPVGPLLGHARLRHGIAELHERVVDEGAEQLAPDLARHGEVPLRSRQDHDGDGQAIAGPGSRRTAPEGRDGEEREGATPAVWRPAHRRVRWCCR